jgi:hypothetical protein
MQQERTSSCKTHMIGSNTWSNEWNTPDFGDFGCDNCKSEFEDISARMDSFERLDVLEWDRTKAVWTVPQASGNESWVYTHGHFVIRLFRQLIGHTYPLATNGLYKVSTA